MHRFLFTIAFCFLFATTFAQGNFKGRVMENKTRIGLANIWIENLTTHRNTQSDKTGKFTIPAKLGDLVFFRGFAYENDTVLVTSLNNMEVFMQPKQIKLNEVNITTTTLKEEPHYLSADPQLQNKTVRYQRDSKGRLIGGLMFRLSYWKKPEHDRAKLEKKQKEFAMMDRIHEVFTPQTIGRYVPLKDEELDNFISLYTPSVKVFSSNDFNLLDYLNLSYKKYQELPPEKRVPEPLIKQ